MGIVPVVYSIVHSKGSESFTWDLTRVALRPTAVGSFWPFSLAWGGLHVYFFQIRLIGSLHCVVVAITIGVSSVENISFRVNSKAVRLQAASLQQKKRSRGDILRPRYREYKYCEFHSLLWVGAHDHQQTRIWAWAEPSHRLSRSPSIACWRHVAKTLQNHFYLRACKK